MIFESSGGSHNGSRLPPACCPDWGYSGFAVGTSGDVVVDQGCGAVTPAQSTNGSYFCIGSQLHCGYLVTRHTSYDRIDLVVAERVGSVDASGRYAAEVPALARLRLARPLLSSLLSSCWLRFGSGGWRPVTDIQQPLVWCYSGNRYHVRQALLLSAVIWRHEAGGSLWTGSTWKQVAYRTSAQGPTELRLKTRRGCGQYTKVVPLPWQGRFQSPGSHSHYRGAACGWE